MLSPEEVRPKVPFFYVLISGARFEGEFSKAQFEKFASQGFYFSFFIFFFSSFF